MTEYKYTIDNNGNIREIGKVLNCSIPTELLTDEQAKYLGFGRKVETIKPKYNPETQYLTYKYKRVGNDFIQEWEVHDIEPSKETLDLSSPSA